MVRSASEHDAARIVELMRSIPGFWHDGWRPNVIELAIAAAGDLACVWEENGEILGFVCAHDLGVRAYLSELVVAHRAQGKGIGKSLVEHIQATLAARGCTVLISDVWRDAEGFYKSLGWSAPDVVLLRKHLRKLSENAPKTKS